MTDDVGSGRDRSMNVNYMNNIVLKSSYANTALGTLRFCHANPGSAAAHIDDINRLFNGVEMHVIAISETWYKGWHANKRICIPGYRVIRADRKDGRRGGGVAMFIKSNLKFKVLARSSDACCINYLFVELKYHGNDVLVGLVYNPPRIDGLSIYFPILEELYTKYEHSIFLGDLNINLLMNTEKSLQLRQKMESVSLTVVSREATNFSAAEPTLIDICATTQPGSIKMFSQLSLPEMSSEHDLIYGSYKICEVVEAPPENVPHLYRSYSRINMEQLYHDVNAQNWHAIYDMPDPDEQLRHFNAIVLWLLDLHAPLRRYIKKDDVNPWFTFDIERAMVERDIAYRVWRRRRRDQDRNRYKEQRKRVNYMVREAKRSYMKRYLNPNLPPKNLWRNLDEIGAKETADNNIIFTPDQLNTFFAAPRPAAPVNRSYTRTSQAELSFNATYDLEVFNAIYDIKSNAIGMDGIPVRFIKLLMPYILPYITHIFNTILTTSKFPTTWKTSKIMPIAKNNDPATLSDYRPVSILPALSKAMEIIIRRQITGYVERNGMISQYQSGFRANHSTSSTLLRITDDLLIASEEKYVSVLLLLDFSKAFDSVDHRLLCAKLSNQYGFSTSAVAFIRSYLSQRMQCVWVNGGSSECLPVGAGVVQGSVLGPLLFTLFINDIVNQISFCSYHLYADDVQLYFSCRPADFPDCIARLNDDLSCIHRWTIDNQLSINSSKSQALVVNPNASCTVASPQIKLGGNQIACFAKVKSLGLIINQNLTWSDQINKICRNVFFTLKRLWPMAHFTPIETRKKLVTSLIVPQFLYCDVVYSKTTLGLREKLKVAFNSCARYIYGVSRYQHISQYTNRILGVPLDTYYSYRMCCAMFKLIRTGGPRYLFDRIRFGQSSRLFNLITPAHRTAARASSFFVQGAILWNGLPSSVRRENSVGRFREGCLSSLRRSESSGGG
jgi:hypothetical protein